LKWKWKKGSYKRISFQAGIIHGLSPGIFQLKKTGHTIFRLEPLPLRRQNSEAVTWHALFFFSFSLGIKQTTLQWIIP
jgi:hypothetical protein